MKTNIQHIYLIKMYKLYFFSYECSIFYDKIQDLKLIVLIYILKHFFDKEALK